MRPSVLALIVLAVACSAADPQAQRRRPQAEVTPIVETAKPVAGGETRLTLKVTLPATMHVQSNKPSDPAFIPTVLTIAAPAGVAVAEIVYPASAQLKQEGLKDPLIVYGSEFQVRVRLKVAKDVKPGALIVPAKLRYQACDQTTCYAPLTAETKWLVQVGTS